jgi:hypothetical protein
MEMKLIAKYAKSFKQAAAFQGAKPLGRENSVSFAVDITA